GIDHLRVDEDAIARHLYTHNLPDPDLVIRTSGEMRLSNFLLWQLAYAEIYVTPTLWPDFRGAQLLEAIEEYQKRERRYGGLGKAPGNVAGALSTRIPPEEQLPVRKYLIESGAKMKRVATAVVLIPIV